MQSLFTYAAAFNSQVS